MFRTIDTHTGGNPTRTVISGIPKLSGSTMAEKMLHMKREHDWIRKLLMYEPRGHDVMSGALLTEPCHPEADVGVIFIETGGYLPMCGHDTIGFCTALAETGMVSLSGPISRLKLDTPAGLVEAELTMEDGKVTRVSFRNIPAFVYGRGEVDVEGLGRVSCRIAYGGNFYAIADAARIGLELVPGNAPRIVECAVRIRRALNAALHVEHPEAPYIRGVTHVEFSGPPVHPQAHVRNTVVVPPGGIDRSPCGTGTSAKLAVLFADGEIGMNEEFVHESIIGSLFRGKVVERVKVGALDAVITEISGTAWITGMHSFYADPEDDVPEGFLLVPETETH